MNQQSSATVTSPTVDMFAPLPMPTTVPPLESMFPPQIPDRITELTSVITQLQSQVNNLSKTKQSNQSTKRLNRKRSKREVDDSDSDFSEPKKHVLDLTES